MRHDEGCTAVHFHGECSHAMEMKARAEREQMGYQKWWDDLVWLLNTGQITKAQYADAVRNRPGRGTV